MSYDGQFPDADIDKSPWQQTVPVTNTGRKRVVVPKCATIFLHIQTTSSLAFKVDGYFRYEQDLPVPIAAQLQSGSATVAGTTITPTAGDIWVLQGAGLHAFDLNVSAGTGAVQVRCSEIPWTVAGGGGGLTLASEIADDAAFGVATSKVIPAGFLADETSPDSVNEGDAGAARMTLDRRVRVETTNGALLQPSVDSYTQAAINLAAGANQSLVSAPGANKQIWVYGIGITVNVAGTVSFQDEDDTAITGIMQLGVTGGFTAGPSGNFAMPIWKVATNKALEVDVVTSELDGWISYALVSV